MKLPRTSQTDMEGHCHRSRDWEVGKETTKAGWQLSTSEGGSLNSEFKPSEFNSTIHILFPI